MTGRSLADSLVKRGAEHLCTGYTEVCFRPVGPGLVMRYINAMGRNLAAFG